MRLKSGRQDGRYVRAFVAHGNKDSEQAHLWLIFRRIVERQRGLASV
jgi:hypothetical protein